VFILNIWCKYGIATEKETFIGTWSVSHYSTYTSVTAERCDISITTYDSDLPIWRRFTTELNQQ
jgi:hypothetical protein